MKIPFAMIAAMLMIMASPARAGDPTFPALSGPVVDVVDEIPDDIEKELDRDLRNFRSTTGHQLQIVVVDDLQGLAIEDYANKLARHWDLGREGTEDGILLIHAPKERKIRIEVADGASPYLPDGLANDIVQDEIIPLFKKGDLVGGIQAGARGIIREASITPEQREEDRRRIEIADQKARQRMKEAFLALLGWLAALGGTTAGGFAIWYAATAGRRRERRERERLERERQEIERTEQRRIAEERHRQRVEQERQAEARRIAERERMLAAMSPAERKRFLDREAARLEVKRQAERAARAAESARVEKKRQAEAAERRRRERSDSTTGIVIGSSGGNRSGGASDGDRPTWSGGGGGEGFGGGGATGDY